MNDEERILNIEKHMIRMERSIADIFVELTKIQSLVLQVLLHRTDIEQTARQASLKASRSS